MAIEISLLKFYAPMNATDPASAEYGGDVNTSAQMTTDVIDNEFDYVTNAERISGLIDYRKQFIRNENSESWEAVKLYISPNTTATMDTVDICQAGTLSLLGATALLSSATYQTATVLVVESDLTLSIRPGEWVYSVVNDGSMASAKEVLSVSSTTVTLTASFGTSTEGTDVIAVCPATMFTYAAPNSNVTGYSVGTIPASASAGVWKRRTVQPNATGQSNNSFTTIWES